MPVVFVTDAPTLWGSDYADIVGVQYEFPDRYRKLVSEGDRFLYYRGSRGAALGVGYFGEGIVGTIGASSKPDHLLAAVHDVELFDDVVPIRDANGDYFETGSTTGTNWANGVRRVDDPRYDAIMAAASATPLLGRSSPGFVNAAHASAMERYSVDVVLDILRLEFDPASIHEMPVNNPGYDIEVVRSAGNLHVEVKGTILPAPVFHLSEGQRKHAEMLGTRWRLYVVYDIKVGLATHKVVDCTATHLETWGNLKTEVWSGVLVEPSP